MNTLLSLRTNILYSKEPKEVDTDPDVFKRHQELIFLVDKPLYRRTNDGEVIRERGVDEFRIIVSEKSFDALLDILNKLKTINESELL